MQAEDGGGEVKEQIDRECVVCGEQIAVPNKGLGRAVLAAWETRHQHPEIHQANTKESK